MSHVRCAEPTILKSDRSEFDMNATYWKIMHILLYRLPKLRSCWVILHAFMLPADFPTKLNIFEKFFQEYHQSVKEFGAGSGSTCCPDLGPNSMLTVKVIRRQQKLPLDGSRSDLNCEWYSVFVKTRQPAKIATYFAFCASYFDKLVHRLYYKAMNLARFMTMSASYSKI